MSKYYKAEGVERLIENICNVMIGKEEPIETALCELPTIEVSEEVTRPFEYFEGYEDGRKSVEVNEDCISREWVLEEFEKGKEMLSKSEYFDELAWLVTHAPSVAPKRAEGEWIYCSDQSGYIGNPVERCSVCGDEYEQAPFNYCPNCGAKMKG